MEHIMKILLNVSSLILFELHKFIYCLSGRMFVSIRRMFVSPHERTFFNNSQPIPLSPSELKFSVIPFEPLSTR